MAQFTVYQSTDGSAPVLTDAVGSLVALLDACLVDGYGAKAGAGWTQPHTGANKCNFKQGSGSGFYLRVQDDGPGTGAGREARMTGYDTMSDVDTGTNPFPTAAQGVGGVAMVVCRKNETVVGTARPWVIFADSRTVYVLISWNSGVYGSFVFGDFYSTAAGDTSNCLIMGRAAEAGAGAAATGERLDVFSAINAAVTASFIAHSYTNLGASVLLSKHGDGQNSATTNVGIQQYPNGGDGGLYLSHVHVGESALANVRGFMRGYWHYCHAAANLATFDVFQGTGAFAGRAFIGFKSGNTGIHIFETSNTLDTN